MQTVLSRQVILSGACALYKTTMLTVVALDCVNVHRGVEFSRAEESSTVERVSRAVGRRAEGAGEYASAHPIVLVLLLLSRTLHVHLLLLCPLHIMDAHKETVVHDLQGGQELKNTNSITHAPAQGVAIVQNFPTPVPT